MINADGNLIELDGTKKGPLVIQEGCDNLLLGTVKEVQRRLEDGEISDRLNMMSLNVAE